MAIYKDIRLGDLQKLLVGAFAESNFALLAATTLPEGLVEFEFGYPRNADGRDGSVRFKFRVDGTLAGGRCANCFLRWGQVQGEEAIGNLPWMAQYDLSSRLYPDLDRAYALVRDRSRPFIDPRHGFDYRNRWDGERNRLPHSNAFVGIGLPALKREIARALTDAGFVLLRDSDPAADAARSSLAFVFPIEPGRPEGAAYSIQFSSQFDGEGNCFPCEVTRSFDPHQALPPLGISAIPSRLTLASRFESGLNDAYDRMQAATQQYLRPRTQFARPPKTATLGTPRPPVAPAVVT